VAGRAALGRDGPGLTCARSSGKAHTTTAEQLVVALAGMRVLVLTTSSVAGRPRSSALDGHFLSGRWVFTTRADSVKARDIA